MADELEQEDCERDYRRLKENHLKAGYVEGLEAGEESSIQQGFNEGFSESVTITFKVSKLLGSISAALAFLESQKQEDRSEVIKDIIKLKEEVTALEQRTLYHEKHATEHGDHGSENKNTSELYEDQRNQTQCSKKEGDNDMEFKCCVQNGSEKDISCGNNCTCGTSGNSSNNTAHCSDTAQDEQYSENKTDNDVFNDEIDKINKYFHSLLEQELLL